MSDTPRTDAEHARFARTWHAGMAIHVDFARQLERELVAVTAERDALLARGRTVRIGEAGKEVK